MGSGTIGPHGSLRSDESVVFFCPQDSAPGRSGGDTGTLPRSSRLHPSARVECRACRRPPLGRGRTDPTCIDSPPAVLRPRRASSLHANSLVSAAQSGTHRPRARVSGGSSPRILDPEPTKRTLIWIKGTVYGSVGLFFRPARRGFSEVSGWEHGHGWEEGFNWVQTSQVHRRRNSSLTPCPVPGET